MSNFNRYISEFAAKQGFEKANRNYILDPNGNIITFNNQFHFDIQEIKADLDKNIPQGEILKQYYLNVQ